MVSSYNQCSIESWDKNADCWNQLMGEGSPFQKQIVDPLLDKLIPPVNGEAEFLEIGCGNGFLANRLVSQYKARVSAFDSSEKAIACAKRSMSGDGRLHYFVADATDSATYSLLKQKFDIAICNMAFMDIADIAPIFRGVSKVLKSDGAFVVSQTHPCFEKSVGPLFFESNESDGGTERTCGVKVTRYLKSSASQAKAVPELPEMHWFFHRPLSKILGQAFHEGFILDGFEEGAFPQGDSLYENAGWHQITEVPVVAAFRFRLRTDLPLAYKNVQG